MHDGKQRANLRWELDIKNISMKQVQKYNYLGSVITDNGKQDRDFTEHKNSEIYFSETEDIRGSKNNDRFAKYMVAASVISAINTEYGSSSIQNTVQYRTSKIKNKDS